MILISGKLKSTVALLLLLATVISLLCTVGCNGDGTGDDTSDDEPGDDFTGSITNKDDGDGDEDDGNDSVDIGDETQTYHISTAEELREKLKLKGTYILDADIDLSGEDWVPVGTFDAPFVGKFDGNGHTVSGLTVSKESLSDDKKGSGLTASYTYVYLALFGCTENAEIRDLTVTDCDIEYHTNEEFTVVYAAAISAFSRGTTVKNCKVYRGKLSVSSKTFKACAGGVSGVAYSSEISGCTTENTKISVTASAHSSCVGGTVGHSGSDVEIYGCKVLSSTELISNSLNGNAYCGGITGYLYNSLIKKCSSAASVSATNIAVSDSDGFSPESKGAAIAGGLVAYSGGLGEDTESTEKRSLSEVLCSVSTGNVSALSTDHKTYAGGIIGVQAFTEVTDSYSLSTVSSQSTYESGYAGGFTAYLKSDASYKGTFFAGKEVRASSTNGSAYCNIAIGNLSATDELDKIYDRCAYLKTSTVVANGEKLPVTGQADLIEGYTKDIIGSLSELVANMGWNASEWINNIGGYPQIKLT